MAQRRMFSQRITSSARFLKMPISSQALYFHLCLNADDDGIVEAWRVMQLAGFGEDDVKVLASRLFVKILNEDLVTYVLDWNEHNVIRADRKVDSVYKNLLLQVIPDAPVVCPVPRSDVADNSRRIAGQSTDSPRTSQGRHRLGKVRVGEDRLGKVSTAHGDKSPTPSEIAREFFGRQDPYQKCIEALSKKTSQAIVVAEIDKFILYWTEPNKSGTKVRWEQESTFEVGRRLKTWLDRVNGYQRKTAAPRQSI